MSKLRYKEGGVWKSIAPSQKEFDDNKAEVTASLADMENDKASKTEVDTKLAQVVSGSPKGVYDTLLALQTAFPTGTTGVYVVKADRKWFYWNGIAWTEGGIYEATTLNGNDIYNLLGWENPKEYVSLTNYMTSNVNNWTPITATANTVGDVTTMTATGTGGQVTKTISLVTGNKYWVKATIKATTDKAYLYVSSLVGVYHSGSGSEEVLSSVVTAASGSTTLRIRDYSTSGWQPIEISKIVIIDLTAKYGAGNEPTNEQMLSLVSFNYSNVYFAGTKELVLTEIDNKKILSSINGVTGFYDLTEIVDVGGSHLANKKIVRFGDSITESDPSNAIAVRTGAEVVNVGFGGCRMAYHGDPAYNALSMTRLADSINTGDWSLQLANQVTTPTDDNTVNVQKLVNMDWNTVDIITIAYGTNDFTGLVPPGTVDDTIDTTMSGAVNHIIEKISSVYPHIHIVFFTPMWRARQATGDGKDSDTVPTTQGVYLIELVDAIIKTAEKNHVPTLDLYRHSGINKYTAATYLAAGDLLHPNALGWEHIANKEASFLLSTF